MAQCSSPANKCNCMRHQGWYSKNHATRDAQDAAKLAYQNRKQDRPKQHWDDDLKVWVKDGC